jgi:hypothetical protein
MDGQLAGHITSDTIGGNSTVQDFTGELLLAGIGLGIKDSGTL